VYLQAIRDAVASLSYCDDDEEESRSHVALAKSFDSLCATILPLIGQPPALIAPPTSAAAKQVFGHKMLFAFGSLRASPEEFGMSPAALRATYRVISPRRESGESQPGASRTSSHNRSQSDAQQPQSNKRAEEPVTPKTGRASTRDSPAEAFTPKSIHVSARETPTRASQTLMDSGKKEMIPATSEKRVERKDSKADAMAAVAAAAANAAVSSSSSSSSSPAVAVAPSVGESKSGRSSSLTTNQQSLKGELRKSEVKSESKTEAVLQSPSMIRGDSTNLGQVIIIIIITIIILLLIILILGQAWHYDYLASNDPKIELGCGHDGGQIRAAARRQSRREGKACLSRFLTVIFVFRFKKKMLKKNEQWSCGCCSES
jgi:hypothetical protein